MGIALLGMATLQTFSEPGFRAALIQRKQGAQEFIADARQEDLRAPRCLLDIDNVCPHAVTLPETLPLKITYRKVYDLEPYVGNARTPSDASSDLSMAR